MRKVFVAFASARWAVLLAEFLAAVASAETRDQGYAQHEISPQEDFRDFPEFPRKFSAVVTFHSEGVNGTGFMQRSAVSVSSRRRAASWNNAIAWAVSILFILIGARQVNGYQMWPSQSVVGGLPIEGAALLGFQRSTVLHRGRTAVEVNWPCEETVNWPCEETAIGLSSFKVHRGSPVEEDDNGDSSFNSWIRENPIIRSSVHGTVEVETEADTPVPIASLFGFQRARRLAKTQLPFEGFESRESQEKEEATKSPKAAGGVCSLPSSMRKRAKGSSSVPNAAGVETEIGGDPISATSLLGFQRSRLLSKASSLLSESFEPLDTHTKQQIRDAHKATDSVWLQHGVRVRNVAFTATEDSHADALAGTLPASKGIGE